MIWDIISAYEAAKTALVPANQDLRALVHIHVGLAIWLGLVIVCRRGLESSLPLAGLIAASLANEAFDLAKHWPVNHSWVWRDMAGDTFNTLLWPVLIWLYATWRSMRSPPAPLTTRDRDIVDPSPAVADEHRRSEDDI